MIDAATVESMLTRKRAQHLALLERRQADITLVVHVCVRRTPGRKALQNDLPRAGRLLVRVPQPPGLEVPKQAEVDACRSFCQNCLKLLCSLRQFGLVHEGRLLPRFRLRCCCRWSLDQCVRRLSCLYAGRRVQRLLHSDDTMHADRNATRCSPQAQQQEARRRERVERSGGLPPSRAEHHVLIHR